MLGERCSHGKTWAESCPECDLISAREIEVHWGEMVDEARAKIAEAEAVKTEAEATP